MSLNCVFCKKPVFGRQGVTVPEVGPAHLECYQAHKAMKRTFKGLDITALSDDELSDLKDLVLAEENDRRRRYQELMGDGSSDDDIELF
jgi:hypothetical protein